MNYHSFDIHNNILQHYLQHIQYNLRILIFYLLQKSFPLIIPFLIQISEPKRNFVYKVDIDS